MQVQDKSPIDTYIAKTLKAQRAASEKARRAYEKSGFKDHKMVIDFHCCPT